MSREHTEMIPVPLPNEVPQPPRLDQLPPDILHSATVELLIQQNEDLTARLKVSLRNNSQMELRIQELEKTNQELVRLDQSRQARLAVIDEKEKNWIEQKREKDQTLQRLEKENQLLESSYSELSVTSRQIQKNLKEEIALKRNKISNLEKKLFVFSRVRKRAKTALRQFLHDMASVMNREKQEHKKQGSLIRLLKNNLETTSTELQEKAKTFEEQLDQLKNQYKNKLMQIDKQRHKAEVSLEASMNENKIIQQKISQMEIDLHTEKKNRHRIQRLSSDLSTARNKIIELERDHLEKVDRLELGEKQKSSDLTRVEQELKNSEEQLVKTKRLLSTCEAEVLKYARDNKELSHQLQSTEKLWIESQDQLEKMKLKIKSLERLNKGLSSPNS